MKTTSKAGTAGGIGDVLADLLNAQFRLGAELMETVSRTRLPGRQSCCDIPEPCWMPDALGEVLSHACPGATAIVRLLITNCDRIPRTVKITATGDAAGLVSLQPTTLVLGPKERGLVSATLKVPPDAIGCQEFEALVWIRGCREHYLRWTVAVEKRGGDCCHEVEVEDCPDLIHHWYDHFYCLRPCFHDLPKTVNHG